jgi:peroxiredoxin
MKFLFIIYSIFATSLLYGQTYIVGDKVGSFTLTNAIENNQVSLADFQNSKGVVIVFTNHSCPYSKLYENRLLKLASEFQSKDVRFILINTNSLKTEDQQAGMAQHAKQNNYPFPYLIDAGGITSKQFGASKTPETFVLKNINGSFVLFYKGAIDDNPQTANDVSSYYLKDAINSLITNSPIKVSEKRASGCMITSN